MEEPIDIKWTWQCNWSAICQWRHWRKWVSTASSDHSNIYTFTAIQNEWTRSPEGYSGRSYWWIQQAANKIPDWFKTSQCWNEMECVRWQPGYNVTHLHETEISRLTASWAVRRSPGGKLPTYTWQCTCLNQSLLDVDSQVFAVLLQSTSQAIILIISKYAEFSETFVLFPPRGHNTETVSLSDYFRNILVLHLYFSTSQEILLLMLVMPRVLSELTNSSFIWF